MNASIRFLSWVASVMLFLSGVATLRSDDLLFYQPVDNQSTFGPSELWTMGGVNSEIADDFNVVGSIGRVVAYGFVWGIVDFHGAYVRFYDYQVDGTPGALQQEYFVSSGFDPINGTIDATISPAFLASGRHFVSVQPVINYWYWWSANTNSPRGQPFFFRNLAAGTPTWHHGDNLNLYTNADLAFALYGNVTAPGTVDRLSATTLPRSGFLEIFGSNFGGNGQVFIGGIAAPVSSWSSTRVVAYVPETAPLTTVPVQVVTSPGTTNTKSLTVTARPAPNGRVNWRFRMDGPYSEVRPGVAPDGTIYAIDAFSHLYALRPDGGLKWLVRGAGDKGVAVGLDGSVYVASESFINAYNPDGTVKWTFAQNPRAMICLGVAVGPDGNIFSVATEGLGVFSLTPQGSLRWATPEGYSRPIVDYGEIVFGPNGSGGQQLYFYANDHIRALGLDGSARFSLPGGLAHLRDGFQPAVAPDGSMHTALNAYSPNGGTLWTFATPYPWNVFTPPDIGSDGIHYFGQNLAQLFALNPNGSQRWHTVIAGNVAGPVVDPFNSQLIMGSSETGDHAGYVLSASAADGHELWRVTLPIEDPATFNSTVGIFGFNQFVNTRARWSRDGRTAYIITATATGDNNTSKAFMYSLNATVGSAPTATPTPVPTATPAPVPTATPVPTISPAAASVRCSGISLSAKLVNGSVRVTATAAVQNGSGTSVAGATVDAKWTLPNGSTVTASAITDSGGNAIFTTKSRHGNYTLTVTNIRKLGYTFDAARSVLTQSISR